MDAWHFFSAGPRPTLSRGRRFVGLAGILSLAVLLVGHSVALSVFLWEPGASTKSVTLLVFSWFVSLVGLWLLLRYAKDVLAIPEAARP